jgi:hypothetical protein
MPARLRFPRRLLVVALLLLALALPGLALAPPALAAIASAAAPVVDLQQGWRPEEAELYNHTSEGTNLAPLELALKLPDAARPGHHFLEDLEQRYGFIPSPQSERNPHGLPVGLAIDPRPQRFGDRTYLGLTCAVSRVNPLGRRVGG